MTTKFISIVLLLLSSTAYSQDKTITGKIYGFVNGDKVLLYDPEIEQFIDSTIISNDNFLIKNKLSAEPKILYLTIKCEGKYYSNRLFIAKENITITGNKKDFPYKLKISGSKYQNQYNILNNQTISYQIERDEIVTFLRKETTDTSVEYKSLRKIKIDRMHAIDKVTDSIRHAYVKSNLNTYAAVNEMFYLKTNYNKDDLKNMYNSLDAKYKNSAYGLLINNYLKVGNPLENGDLFYDFEAQDQFGEKRKLSEFIGKYVLLDFTETYCAFCIQSVKELKEVAEKNGEKLTIISFYADKSELIWKEGLKRDQPSWVTLNDGKGTSGETLLKYGVFGYPTFFLIDPTGKIVDNFFGYEDQRIKIMIQNHIR